MRADKLEFNISYSDSAYPESASKLRVFCYMKNGGYAFGDEFEDKYSATFDSNRTSKYSGYGTITIQLLDAEENLINSANVICKIIESNSTTPFVASPDFTEESKREIQAIVDEGKNEIAVATKEAKEKIDNWSDQNSRFVKNESDISDLQLFKANTGALHFNGGNAQCSGLANKPISNINTIAFRWKCDAITFANIPVNQHVIGYVGSWYHLARIDGGLQFYVKYVDGQQFIGLTESNIITLLTDGNWHNIAIISTGTTFDFAIDGKILKSVARSKTTNFAIPTSNFIVSYSTTNIGSIADVFIFNFDIISADALYTIADYQQGKPIPPSLLKLGVQSYNASDMVFSSINQTTYPCEAVSDSATDTITVTTSGEIAVEYTWIQGIANAIAIPQGANVELSIRALDVATSVQGDFYSDSTRVLTLTGVKNNNPTISFVAPANLTRLRLIIHTGVQPIPTGTVLTITGLKIKVNGAVLALEDYTITNGTTRLVFDYSGNNNDAIITGDVKGDNDNRVQKIIDLIKY